VGSRARTVAGLVGIRRLLAELAAGVGLEGLVDLTQASEIGLVGFQLPIDGLGRDQTHQQRYNREHESELLDHGERHAALLLRAMDDWRSRCSRSEATGTPDPSRIVCDVRLLLDGVGEGLGPWHSTSGGSRRLVWRLAKKRQALHLLSLGILWMLWIRDRCDRDLDLAPETEDYRPRAIDLPPSIPLALSIALSME